VLLVPHSVARSKILKRNEIVAFQAMSLKKQDSFLPIPIVRLCFRSASALGLSGQIDVEAIYS
jgi:hypothetical protein